MEKEEIKPYSVTDEVWMVPCLVKCSENQYMPLCKPLEKEIDWESLQSRQTWMPVEDEFIKNLVEKRGPRQWAVVAKELNKAVHKGVPVRQGKQCRERYYNHLDPNLRKGNWLVSEDLTILEKHIELGNKWSSIAKSLKGRTENQVKNRFKSLVRKAEKSCPKGINPVMFLINQIRQPTTRNEVQPISPLILSPSPAFSRYNHYSFADFGFGTLADSLKHYYLPPKTANPDGTPSPSSLLYFPPKNEN